VEEHTEDRWRQWRQCEMHPPAGIGAVFVTGAKAQAESF
jgi:hypothetical protein